MAKEKIKVSADSSCGWALFTAYFGALVYFVERNEGFWGFVLALLQAAVWPAYVVYEALQRLAV